MKIVVGLAAVASAGAAAAQERPQRLPTSNELVPPRAAPAAPAAAPALDPENSWQLDLSTGGRVTIQLRPDLAPNHVRQIKALTRQGFYNGLTFHRVIDGFMAQGGDPTGTGTGGSPLPNVAAEFNVLPHVRGAVAAARAADPNSADSQFYIMLAPRLSLDRKYTVFGRVVSGMNFVDRIEKGEPPANPSRIVRASIGADNMPPLTPQELAAAAQAAQQREAAAAAQAVIAQPAEGNAGAEPAEKPAEQSAPAAAAEAAPETETADTPPESAEETPQAGTPETPQR